jgi:hypothetical protein
MRVKRMTCVVAMAALVGGVVLGSGSVASAQILIGQVAPANPPIGCEEEAAFDEIPFGSTLAAYQAPTAGVITSWSTNAAAGSGQQLRLKVYRRTSAFSFTVVAHDGPRPLAPSALNTFPAAIPVKQGDVIGLSVPSASAGGTTACVFETGNPEDSVHFSEGDHPDGTSASFGLGQAGIRPNVAAALLPPPSIGEIGSTSGSVAGGQPVVVGGANFASVSSVAFGSTPAQSYTVDSEGQITAVAPASKKLAQVPVTVTTVAGAATSAQTFAYRGCKVPNLRRKKLRASKRVSRKSNCRIGTVRKLGKATIKTGKVTKQSPKPGQILPPGTRIKVTLAG